MDYTHEIVKDFFWGLNLYGSYNSEPPDGAEKDDYSVLTSIGWKF